MSMPKLWKWSALGLACSALAPVGMAGGEIAETENIVADWFLYPLGKALAYLAFALFALFAFALFAAVVKAWKQIHRPVGFKLKAFAEFFFSPNAYSKVLEPIIRDLQDEYTQALAANRLWKARYVQMRGTAAFWSALSAQLSSSLVKLLKKAIGVATSSPG